MDLKEKTRELYEDYCSLTGFRPVLSVKDFVVLRREAVREMGVTPAAAYQPQQAPPPQPEQPSAAPLPVWEPPHAESPVRKEAGQKTEPDPGGKKMAEKKAETAPMSDYDILRDLKDRWNS